MDNPNNSKPTALVTGASRGIGAAIATELANKGWYVIGTATTASGAANISATLGSHGQGIQLNVADNQSIEAALTYLDSNFANISLLVNNAGITKDGLLLRMSEQDFMDIQQVHIHAVFKLCKALCKGMIKQRHGRIINISSVVAQMGNAGQTNYVAAKAAIEGFSRALAQEVGSRGITVNCVAPGYIQTDMTDALNDTQQQAMLNRIPMAKLGSPNDVAAAVCFLASADASYITGAVIPVNGGLWMG